MSRTTKGLTKLFFVLLALVSCGCTTRVAVRPGFWYVGESAAKGSTAVTIKKVHPASVAGKTSSFTTDLYSDISGNPHDFDHFSGNATPFIPVYTPKIVGGNTSGTTVTTIYNAEHIRQRSGVILVRNFKDVRTADHNYIGVKRNAFYMSIAHVGLKENASLEAVASECVAEALRHVGYTVIIEGQPASADLKPDAVLDGKIQDFWADAYFSTRHDITLSLSLLDQSGGQVLWKKSVDGTALDAVVFNTHWEYQRIIDRAMEIALEKAMRSFSSDEFALKVKK